MSLSSLARKGRFGDTEIREIDGQLAHVNKYEAALIDSKGLLGERIVKTIGSGTINPLTGLKEYGWWDDLKKKLYGASPVEEVVEASGMLDDAHISGTIDDPAALYNLSQTDSIYGQHVGETLLGQTFEAGGGETGQLSFDQLTAYSEGGDPLLNIPNYLLTQFGIGQEGLKWMTPFETEPFEFLKSGFGLEQQGLGQQFKTGMQTLGRTAGKGFADLSGASSAAKRTSGMATSGTIQQKFEQQKKGLFGDYGTGMQGLQQSYTLGMDKAQLDYDTDVYGEKTRQRNVFYDDIKRIMDYQQG